MLGPGPRLDMVLGQNISGLIRVKSGGEKGINSKGTGPVSKPTGFIE